MSLLKSPVGVQTRFGNQSDGGNMKKLMAIVPVLALLGAIFAHADEHKAHKAVERIEHKANEAKKEIGNKADKAKEEIKHKADKAMKKVDEKAKEGKEKVLDDK